MPNVKVDRLFCGEDGVRKDLGKEHGIKGFTLVDSTDTLRGRPSLVRRKTVVKRFRELVDEIDSLDEPDIVKRTAKMILKDFIEYEIGRVKRFLVGDRSLLVATLIYYARVINSLPAKKPPKVDKRLKRFLFSSDKYSKSLKRGIINRRSVYIALMSSASVMSSYVNKEIYSVSTVLEKYVEKSSNYSTRTIVGAVLYALTLELGWSQGDIAKLFNAIGILKYNARLFYKNNPGLVERITSKIPEDDKEFIEENLRKIVEKVSNPLFTTSGRRS